MAAESPRQDHRGLNGRKKIQERKIRGDVTNHWLTDDILIFLFSLISNVLGHSKNI